MDIFLLFMADMKLPFFSFFGFSGPGCHFKGAISDKSPSPLCLAQTAPLCVYVWEREFWVYELRIKGRLGESKPEVLACWSCHWPCCLSTWTQTHRRPAGGELHWQSCGKYTHDTTETTTRTKSTLRKTHLLLKPHCANEIGSLS